MSQTNFYLTSFDPPTTPNLTITGHVSRQQNKLSVQYVLAGDLTAIIIPASVSDPQRQYDLWEHTCCEFLMGIKNQPEYWEFNLSPSGNWNVFHFSNYRHNLVEEAKLAALPFSVLQQDNFLNLSLTVDLNKLVSEKKDLELGITMVIEDEQHQLSYWALKHPAAEPDFHHRDSFDINLSESSAN